MSSLRIARRGLAAAALLFPCAIRAQPPAPSVWLEYATGDALEQYLRSLQALGDVAVHPWSLRGFSPVELDRLRPAPRAHAWSARLGTDSAAAARLGLVRPRVDVRFNSGFAYGSNDGAVWAGRGATVAVSGGVAARWGPVSLTLNPIAFWTENRPFPLLPNGTTGDARFGDGTFPLNVDRPQRFGDAAYARVDPGQSTLRVDALGVTVGASTANQWWGPAQEFPFLLGTNAAGFQHVFVGTSRPVNLWLARLHTRVLWGRLEQSEYFEITGRIARPRRFATGLVVLLTPRGLENLEIGGARFFHAPWPDEGLPGRYVTRVFEGLYKKSLPEVENPIDLDSRSLDGENQLASVFGRLVLPGTGFEVYGEIGREDHPWDLRHLTLSPDELSSMMLGFRKSWRRGGGMAVLRAETMNFQPRLIDRFRASRPVYVHGAGSNQGHTQRGQLLGADVGVGSAAGAVVGLDLHDAAGRSSLAWRRVVRQEQPFPGDGGGENARALDVIHTIGAERLVFRGGTDLLAGVDLSYNLNRNFAGDRGNVSVRIAAMGLPW